MVKRNHNAKCHSDDVSMLSRRKLFKSALLVPPALVLTPKTGHLGSVTDNQQQGPVDISWEVNGYPELSVMAGLIADTMASVSTSFVGRTGRVFGFDAGDLYPAVFARDFATVSEFAGYLFGSEYLRTPVTEFLAVQEDFSGASTGATPATISPRGEVDKATAVSDEETSLIHAAFVYFKASANVDWLRSGVAGRSVIQRLNDAIAFLFRERRDHTTGLLYRAFTTDWGDVKIEGGPHPTDLLDGDSRIVTIYDQAMAYRALAELIEMNSVVGDEAMVKVHTDRAQTLKKATNDALWDEGLGYFHLHRQISGVEPVATDHIFGVGNLIAVDCGITDQEQDRRIFSNAMRCERLSGSNRPGLSLWPPYPNGVFNHPSMSAFQYQNGGIWDWWGGVQTLAEFEKGEADQGFTHLSNTAQHWAHTGQIAEWHHIPSSSDQGSLNFGGAAATFGLALTKGLFGVSLDAEVFHVRSRLGARTGKITLRHQPSNQAISTSQRTGEDWIEIQVECSGSNSGEVSALLPNSWQAALALYDDDVVNVGGYKVGSDIYSPTVLVESGMHTVTFIRNDNRNPRDVWDSTRAGFFEESNGMGYWISNSSLIPMWDKYKDLGGVLSLGPAISGRFMLGGFVSQAVHRGIMQWSPKGIIFASTMDILSQNGYDDWLGLTHRIPQPAAETGPDLSILDSDSAIKELFLSTSDWEYLYGLPVSYSDYEDVSMIRTQRTVLQRWKIQTPWAEPGQITPANSGLIAKQAGLIPNTALNWVAGVISG